MSIETVLYRAHAKATGGRDGRATSSDNVLDVKLTTPKELGGAGGEGTNPEQLFAAGYSACFIGAMKFVAGQQKIALPADTSIEGSVGIGQIPAGFGIEVELKISIPGMERSRRRGAGRQGAPGVPVLQCHPRQHRRHPDRRLTTRQSAMRPTRPATGGPCGHVLFPFRATAPVSLGRCSIPAETIPRRPAAGHDAPPSALAALPAGSLLAHAPSAHRRCTRPSSDAPIRVGSKADSEGALLGQIIVQLLQPRRPARDRPHPTGPDLDRAPRAARRRARHLPRIHRQRRVLLPSRERSALSRSPQRLRAGARARCSERPGLADARAGRQPLGDRRARRCRRARASAQPGRLRALGQRRRHGSCSPARPSSSRAMPRCPPSSRPMASICGADQLLVLAGGNTSATIKAAAEGHSGVNASMVYSTDGAIAVTGLVMLDDPRHVEPVYQPAPVVRADVLERHPQIAALLAPAFRRSRWSDCAHSTHAPRSTAKRPPRWRTTSCASSICWTEPCAARPADPVLCLFSALGLLAGLCAFLRLAPNRLLSGARRAALATASARPRRRARARLAGAAVALAVARPRRDHRGRQRHCWPARCC